MNKNLIAWILLLIAGMSEVVWAYYLKESKGFSLLYPSLMYFVFGFLSFICLSIAIKYIPISVSYPIWVGIGAVGTVIIGIILFNETISLLAGICLVFIIVGIIGLKLN